MNDDPTRQDFLQVLELLVSIARRAEHALKYSDKKTDQPLWWELQKFADQLEEIQRRYPESN